MKIYNNVYDFNAKNNGIHVLELQEITSSEEKVLKTEESRERNAESNIIQSITGEGKEQNVQ